VDRLLLVLIRLTSTTTVLNVLAAPSCAGTRLVHKLPAAFALELEHVLVTLLVNEQLATLEANTA